jgi:hypothetical protein
MLEAVDRAVWPVRDAGFRVAASAGAPLRFESIAPFEIDAALVRLSVLEARSRLRLGRAAHRFLERRGRERLGFSSVGDYARERLGISGRELQSFARVAARLAALPLLAAAFARGEISWSQARLLCGVATTESEGGWVELARGLTVCELADVIRERGRASAIEIDGVLDEIRDETDGEPRVRFAVRCPARLTVLWRRTVELARRMLGSHAVVWQAAEAIAAEAGSAAAIVVAEVGEPLSPAATTESPVPRLDRIPFDAEESLPLDDFESCDPFDLDVEMRLLVETLREVDARLGHALRRSLDLRAYRARGFGSFDAYVRERLGLSAAKARALVALDRRARERSALGRAYLSGELSWARALAILPVACGVPERAWVARANEVMVRRLHDEVEWALDRRDAYGEEPMPPAPDATLEPPDLQTCARHEGEVPDRRVTFFGPASVVGLAQGAVVSLCGPNEPRWKGLERLLLHAITEWGSQPRHRDPIFARDRWRCSVPGCSARRGLEDHHIEFRSRGGGNEQENRISICASHHHHAVHRSVIRVRGRAPDDVLWELGLRPGRAPLLVLHGERYVSPNAL